MHCLQPAEALWETLLRQESIDAVTAGVQSWDPEEYILNSLLQAVSCRFSLVSSAHGHAGSGPNRKQEAVRNHGRVDLMQKKARDTRLFLSALLVGSGASVGQSGEKFAVKRMPNRLLTCSMP